MPVRRAALSFVPNSEIATSFAHGGAKSISADPIAAKGLDVGSMTAATSSPTPAPSTTDATPATAARGYDGCESSTPSEYDRWLWLGPEIR
jgi:hypothetical protein